MAIKSIELALADLKWFSVQPTMGSPVARKNKLLSHLNYWCRRRSDGTYDIFGGSHHGPYLAGISASDMKLSFRAYRPKGVLRVGTEEEQKKLNSELDWYLSR